MNRAHWSSIAAISGGGRIARIAEADAGIGGAAGDPFGRTRQPERERDRSTSLSTLSMSFQH